MYEVLDRVGNIVIVTEDEDFAELISESLNLVGQGPSSILEKYVDGTKQNLKGAGWTQQKFT